MSKRRAFRWLAMAALLATCLGQTCVPPDGNGGNGGNGDGEAPPDTLRLVTYATNTNGASGIALRPSDGALFAVSRDGLFGPISQNDDLSAMSPIGATNLADDDLFDMPRDSLTLAITNSGEFWIGSTCCSTMAVVPPAGGDAEPFLGLLQGSQPSNIHPETLAIVPSSFTGTEIAPGNLLVGEETTFSRLSAIDVEGDQTVVNVQNPVDMNRQAHHLAFGPDGTFYNSRGVPGLTIAGIQTIDEDGAPANLASSIGLAGDTFAVRSDGDLVLRGRYIGGEGPELRGVIIYSPDTGTITNGVTFTMYETSEDDEMAISADLDVIYLALPERNEIVLVENIELEP